MFAAASPGVRFYRVIESARPPQRADKSALGTMPTRAFRFCDAITSAAGFGWYGFAPMDLSLLWDGEDIFWNYAGVDGWLPLSAAQFPDLSARFDAAAPEDLKGCAPPMLTAVPEPGVVQIWTGMFARSAPGWSLLVRPPANLPLPGGYVSYEGIVEKGKVRLKPGIHLPEKARVYVIVPDLQVEKTARVLTPRLVNSRQAADFKMEVSEEKPNASL